MLNRSFDNGQALREARALVQQCWTQGAFATDGEGRPCGGAGRGGVSTISPLLRRTISS